MVDIPGALNSRLALIAVLAAQKAGDILRRGFGSTFGIHTKEGRHNLVTDYDKEVEEMLVQYISSHFPDHSFLGEEEGAQHSNPDSILWIIDPLDGTVNFAHNIPMFCTSIAATYKNEVLAGAVYQPITGELFVAEKGNGAYFNGSRISVSKTDLLDHAILATGFPYNVHENPHHCIELFSKFAKMGAPLRRIGSAALDLCYVAAGRFDAFWEVSLHPWDYAAGKLILEEAGGMLTDFNDNPFSELVEGTVAATNGLLHEQLTKHLEE
ncbi:MAG: Inositol-1-monophosphatase [Chlamydiia bacterium]|nr:Inositol-1-monophosphatase [Chlamydiia bacterium]MCH9615791.1 Inositol-1-monophosphatase [Chlamydiia bacterium]MCH9628806.1 Inositol-1-monophosphatase [Chlamydiia bacterium]